jgi:hypothetical protein
MIGKHFPSWDYSAVTELEEICRTLPILPLDRAEEFFKQAGQATGREAKGVERQSGLLFESLRQEVGRSATCDDENLETLGYGVMMVEIELPLDPDVFCLARISEKTFLTRAWVGGKERQTLKNLLSMPYSSAVE